MEPERVLFKRTVLYKGPCSGSMSVFDRKGALIDPSLDATMPERSQYWLAVKELN